MYLSKFHLSTSRVFRDRQPPHFLRKQFWAHALIHIGESLDFSFYF